MAGTELAALIVHIGLPSVDRVRVGIERTNIIVDQTPDSIFIEQRSKRLKMIGKS